MKTCGKPYHGTLGIVVNCSEETPCRDCLLIEVGRLEYMVQSLQGEIGCLRSAPVAVEVPELTLAEAKERARGTMHPGVAFGWGYDLAVSSIRTIPSDRILKEGEIHGTPEDLAAIAEGAGWEWIRSHIGGKILVDYMADALRSQRTENECSNHHVPN